MSEIEDANGGDDDDGTGDGEPRGGGLWRDVRPHLGQIAFACHGDRLRRAARAVTNVYDDALAPLQIRLPQLTLLAHVWESGPGGVGVVELARRMATDRSTASRAAASVLRRKMVERGYRSRAFRLTPAGCDLVAAALPHWKQAQAYIADSLRWDERMGMERCLRKLVRLRFPDPYGDEGG